MRICVLGLAGAAPEIIFSDERLVNIRRLMDFGVYGRVESLVPHTLVPAWMCMSTSQDAGSLGVYGPHNRSGYHYEKLIPATPASFDAPAIWDEVIKSGNRAILMGVPPNDPPRNVRGISIASLLTTEATANQMVDPVSLTAKISELAGGYPAAAAHGSSLDEVLRVSQKQWPVARWLLAEEEWGYFHFVDLGLERLGNEAGQRGISDYYLWLDEQVGAVLELMDDQTILLLLSANGRQEPNSALGINARLAARELLVLNQGAVPANNPANADVDWKKTKAWSEGGQIFFNAAGREPLGLIAAEEYESFRDETKVWLQEQGISAVKPNDIYRDVRNVAPDLIISAVTGETQHGVFVLTGPNCPLNGEYEGAGLLDMAPTLLDLAGYPIPASMQGRSLVSGMERKTSGGDEDQLLHDRLAGLGYI